MHSAREVFETRGYEKATVAEIAAKCGVVEGTVFSHFGSKRQLVLKVMEAFYEQITHQIETGIRDIEGARNKLFYVIWSHLNVVSENSAICSVMLRESRGVEHTFMNELNTFNRRYSRIVGDIVEEGIKDGIIYSDISIVLVRNTVFGSIEHYMWSMLHSNDEMNVDAIAEQLTDLVFYGISSESKTKVAKQAKDDAEVRQLIARLNKLL